MVSKTDKKGKLMKKLITLSLACLMLLCACENKSSPEKTTISDTATIATTTTAATTSTTTSATTSATTAAATTSATTTDKDEITTTAAPDQNKTLLCNGLDGEPIYQEDENKTTSNEYIHIFDFAFYRESTGTYYDSEANPELFDVATYVYSGDYVTATESDYKRVKAGDKIGGLTVKTAMTYIEMYGSEEATIAINSINFDGEIQLTGTLRFFYDEMYTVASGDMEFVPDASYKGMPYAGFPTYEGAKFGTISMVFDDENKYLGGSAIYTDAIPFRLGNYFEKYSDMASVRDIVGGADKFVSKKVRITLSNVRLNTSIQMSSLNTTADIVAVEAL